MLRTLQTLRLKFPPWRSLRARLIMLGIAAAYLVLFFGDTPGGNSLDERVLGRAKDVLFNYVEWELDAISFKLRQQQAGLSPYLSEAQRSAYVVDYLALVRKLQALEARIDSIYSDPKVQDREAATAVMREQRDILRGQVAAKHMLAEAIIEEQVATVLRDEGFGILGVILPSVSAHVTPLPMVLVVSPRDRIRYEVGVTITNIPVERREALEASLDSPINVSSLVLPIGGLSLYPSMAAQSWYAPFVFDVAAHEWTHHYLMFFPLGLNYESSGDSRTINETTATLLGQEIARKVILRYYKDYKEIVDQLPPLDPPQPAPRDPNTRPAFDFGAAMNETRVTVDKLLVEGKIEEAERYMAERRVYFAQNGRSIRKLNQAYFAFYGGYQSQSSSSPGASGADPTGEAIAEVRRRSGSLREWLQTMRGITNRDQLLSVRDSLRRTQP